jgi:hypothetical protein
MRLTSLILTRSVNQKELRVLLHHHPHLDVKRGLPPSAQKMQILGSMHKIRHRLEKRFEFRDGDLYDILRGRAKRARENIRKTAEQKAKDGARSHKNARRNAVGISSFIALIYGLNSHC